MAAATKITQEQIDELIRKGKANKGVLTYGDVMNLTNTLEDITPEDVEHIYEVITRKGLELVDDDNASDEDILPLVGNDEDNDEPSSSELENMSVPEGISIDDPVRMYLKEIGKVPLLSPDEEIDLAQRMAAGAEAEQTLFGALLTGQTLPLGAAHCAQKDAVGREALVQLMLGQRVAVLVDGLAAHRGVGVVEGVAVLFGHLIENAEGLLHDLGAGAVAPDDSNVFFHSSKFSSTASYPNPSVACATAPLVWGALGIKGNSQSFPQRQSRPY
mgnify:CR=1 FL=1